MNYHSIGRTGIQVSQLCFGTMSFGSYSDAQASRAMFARCREAGINFFDCANSYAGSRAESILGECIAEAGCRDEVVLVSKVCRPMSADINGRGLSRHHIMREVEHSLRRLRTDCIDFYFMHHYDPLTPIEESLRAFDDLQRQGKILYPAVSNWSAWRIAKALGISERQAWARFELIQPMYNLVKRQAETELFPLAESEQLGTIVYSPLASGLLTGLYGVDRAPEQGRLNEARYQQRYSERTNYEIADAFTDFCREHGYAPPALAVAWAMSHPAVTAPIVGAETVEQLDGYLAALDIPMDAALRAQVSALSLAPEAGTERTVD
jgi:aryl-alcohol dehydrogenase-like predicted oxidoreductase